MHNLVGTHPGMSFNALITEHKYSAIGKHLKEDQKLHVYRFWAPVPVLVKQLLCDL